MKWKFIKGAEPQFSTDFWYDLADGGHIEPEKILSSKAQVDKLRQAINLISDFHKAITKAGLLDDI